MEGSEGLSFKARLFDMLESSLGVSEMAACFDSSSEMVPVVTWALDRATGSVTVTGGERFWLQEESNFKVQGCFQHTDRQFKWLSNYACWHLLHREKPTASPSCCQLADNQGRMCD